MSFNVENYKKSLLIERAAYVAKNMPERVKLVDKELARLDGLLSTGNSRPLDVQVIKDDPVTPTVNKRKPTKKKDK
jgi:hypothetical protein